MQPAQKRIYEFDSFRIDTQECQLTQNGNLVPLTAKVFEILLTLVENRGRTLRRDELMEKVWAESFVEEGNLSRNISTLRKVLGDDFHNPRFIITVPKRGYRFERDVREILEETEELVVERRTRYNLSISGKTVSALSPYFRQLAAALTVVLIGSLLAVVIGLTKKNAANSAKAEAVDLYERGRELWKNRSAAGLHEATLLLERVVEKDPNFALGYAALADAYAFDTGNWKKAEETAAHAIALDPNLGEPHASLGFVELFWKWNPAEAEQNFKRSVALSPEYATARQWYAIKLAIDGQFNEAIAEINRALELEPHSVAMNADFCQILYFVQRYGEAEAQCKKTLALDPHFFAAHLLLYDIYTAKGMYPEAVEEFFKTEQLAANHSTLPEHLEDLKSAFERGGIGEFWRVRIETLERQSPGGYLAAKYYARLGENDKALQALSRAYEKRDFDFPFFYSEPVFVKCCGVDRRFHELRYRWTPAKN